MRDPLAGPDFICAGFPDEEEAPGILCRGTWKEPGAGYTQHPRGRSLLFFLLETSLNDAVGEDATSSLPLFRCSQVTVWRDRAYPVLVPVLLL